MPASRDFRSRVQRRFCQQQQFAASTAPLYSFLFGLMANWLRAEPGQEPLADWLLQVGAKRSSFSLPLLLMAGLHRDILTDHPATQELARFYSTAGGHFSGREHEQAQLNTAFRKAVLTRKDMLATFISNAAVQTNETARGLCWLLPSIQTGWSAVHLAELGASAGLNLAADERRYDLYEAEENTTCNAEHDIMVPPLLSLGRATAQQFTVMCRGDGPNLTLPISLPRILSRSGCDLAPCILKTTEEEQTLAAFIWGDQAQRLQRLREGIVAQQRLESSSAPLCLERIELPGELPLFLKRHAQHWAHAPLIVFNTYLNTYLPDKGAALQAHLADWSKKRQYPLLWLQWETLWHAGEQAKTDSLGRLAWTADLWLQGGRHHHHWHLAWAHPHGTVIQWLPEHREWQRFWQE